MNREDALYNAKHLSKTYHNLCNDTEGFWEAVINALEQEPPLEKIRATLKQDLENAKKDFYEFGEVFDNGYVCGLEIAFKIIDKYASEECDNDCEHCAYLECPKEPCEDAISRSTAKTRVYLKYIGKPELCKEIFAILDELPSVQPKASENAVISNNLVENRKEIEKEYKKKSWEWVFHFNEKKLWFECEYCHNKQDYPHKNCPKCGATMSRSQDEYYEHCKKIVGAYYNMKGRQE